MADIDQLNEDRLSQKEKAVLYAAYKILDSRFDLHVSIERIRQRMIGKAQFKLKKPLNSLVAKSLLQKHPTGGGMTFSPTREGISRARNFFPELFQV